MRSGRSATSFSASPGLERSETPALAPATEGGTTSCSTSSPIFLPPIAPSVANRSVSLRPIMPAAPMMRTRWLTSRLPIGIPQPPKGDLLLHAAGLQVGRLREVLQQHALRGIAQVGEAE